MIIFLLILILFLIIVIHELGHFWAAKKSGVVVEEFGIGLPPRIFAKKIKGTLYSLNLLPFGAFVKIFGEETKKGEKGSFYSVSAGKRAFIISSGPLFNIIFAFLILSIGFSTIGFPSLITEENSQYVKKGTEKVLIFKTVEGLPAEKAGLKSQDVILKINNELVNSSLRLQEIIAENKNTSLLITVKRDGEELSFSLVPKITDGEAKIGVELFDFGYVKYPFIKAIGFSLTLIYRIFLLIFGIIFYLFQKLFYAPEILETISGPVGIFFILKSAFREGVNYFLFILAQISLSLGIINLFPFPALDGFRLLFVGVEKIFRNKKISPQLEHAINTIGLLILIFLLLIVSYSDFLKYIKK